MRLNLPHSLHYPITVTELRKQPNDHVEKRAVLFAYTYETLVPEQTRDGVNIETKRTFPSTFESSVEGVLKSWNLRKGDVISRPGHEIAEIEEPCAHGVQFGGMCVNCGKDMTEESYVTIHSDAKRATINMIHDNTALLVSQSEVSKVEEEAKRRLLGTKKLSLVVDLDQTIIHATVDPTVAEWQKDSENPNYEAVKDVRAFQLTDEGPGGKGTWYYIKLRPGLADFLENVSKIYELHIYTMGTRAYAQAIAKLVDPDRKIFGDRILSRDESGSMVAKSLQRLFPVDTKMVVIIDDRGDVWHWNANLIKVTAFSFFVGIGDINSSFLPKRAKTRSVPKPSSKVSDEKGQITPPTETNGGAEDEKPAQSSENAAADPNLEIEVSALEQLVSMGGGDNPEVLKEQNASQDKLLTAQLEERPLLQKQKQLDEEDEEEDAEKPRHHLLNDDDNELFYLERSLRRVHTEFFEIYSQELADNIPGRLAQLRKSQTSPKKKAPTANADLDLIPDIKQVMPMVKSRVLAGVNIVFSGVVPLDTDYQNAEIVVWAKSFGARIQQEVKGRSTTHVVAARNRTAKVRQAVRKGKGRIKVVNLHWLMDCIVQWEKVPEEPYLLKTEDADLGKPFPDEDDDNLSESESLPMSERESEANNDLHDATESDVAGRKRLRINTSRDADVDTDTEELAALEPDTLEDPTSPIGGGKEDWDAMNDELLEFLGSDADESEDEDGESTASNDGGPRQGAPKRSHEDMTGDEEDSEAPTERKKPNMGLGASGPREQVSDSGLPTPAKTAEGEGDADEQEKEEAEGDGGSQHGWSDFDDDEINDDDLS